MDRLIYKLLTPLYWIADVVSDLKLMISRQLKGRCVRCGSKRIPVGYYGDIYRCPKGCDSSMPVRYRAI